MARKAVYVSGVALTAADVGLLDDLAEDNDLTAIWPDAFTAILLKLRGALPESVEADA